MFRKKHADNLYEATKDAGFSARAESMWEGPRGKKHRARMADLLKKATPEERADVARRHGGTPHVWKDAEG
ncbi:hypothetical protein ACIBI0_38625 [Microbispora rosea]|uniref:hypothetical protein n=1 Tax=Microbispora rosea TaxID=58117 RepID=UPI0037AAF4C6